MQPRRLFVAAHLPEAIASVLEQRQQMLRQHLGELQSALCWTPKTQYHLTLAFLGSVGSSAIPTVVDAMETHCQKIPPQQLTLGKCGFFARRGVPTVLWSEVHASPALTEWSMQLRQIMQPLCPEMDGKEFHPHLTLARIKRGRSIERATLIDLFAQTALCIGAPVWECGEVSLVHSEHCCHGAVHSLVHTSRLGEARS